jgi:predicted outer membrane repeat protein
MIRPPLSRPPAPLVALVAAVGLTTSSVVLAAGRDLTDGGSTATRMRDVAPIEAVFEADPTIRDGAKGSLRWALGEAVDSGVPAAVRLGSGSYILDAGCRGRNPQAADDSNDLATDAAVGDLDSGDTGSDLVLVGDGATVMATCPDYRVFEHHGTGTLKLEGIVLRNGEAFAPFGQGRGGGILSEQGATVVLANSVLRDNLAESSGGAIYAAGDGAEVELRDSTLMGNVASTAGGGGAAVLGDLRVINSTIANNRAATHGAATADSIELRFATITDNTATEGTDGSQLGASQLSSAASVIVDGRGSIDSCDAERTETGGYNFGDDESCGFSTSLHDAVKAGPARLAALSAYSGHTFSRPPLPESPLRDVIPPRQCLGLGSRDQLGALRPSGRGCEVGSVEITPGLDLSGSTPAPAAGAATAAVVAAYTG